MNINRANLAWCSDITYIKLPQGHVYLVAMVDIYSRMILDYEISNTLDAEFCVRCLERCIKRYGAPAVFNTDEGVQYTSNAWINLLQINNIIVSMDGKGRWADNIWIERIWQRQRNTRPKHDHRSKEGNQLEFTRPNENRFQRKRNRENGEASLHRKSKTCT